MIYVIRSAAFKKGSTTELETIIKIGYTGEKSRKARKSVYLTENPTIQVLYQIEGGTERDEKNLHRYFSNLRVYGKEWFKDEKEILDFFETHKTRESLRGIEKSVKRIQDVLLEKFVKGLTPLKTKELSKEIATQWKLLQKKYGDEVATDHYINFLNETLTDEFVKKIQEAKSNDSDKGKVSKDEIRKKQLRTAFDRFVGKQGFDIEMY